MAIVFINKFNKPDVLAKDETQARQIAQGSFSAYQDGTFGIMLNVTNDDFVMLQKGHKEISYNGTNYVLTDLGTEFYMTRNKESLILEISEIKRKLELALVKHKSNSFISELNAYKQAIESVNVDNLNYPLNKTLNQHLLDEGFTTVLHPLQIA
jgi:hypothetical protein